MKTKYLMNIHKPLCNDDMRLCIWYNNYQNVKFNLEKYMKIGRLKYCNEIMKYKSADRLYVYKSKTSTFTRYQLSCCTNIVIFYCIDSLLP